VLTQGLDKDHDGACKLMEELSDVAFCLQRGPNPSGTTPTDVAQARKEIVAAARKVISEVPPTQPSAGLCLLL